jgi:hypothetical protein
MNDVQFDQEGFRAVQSSARNAAEDGRPERINRAVRLGAVALGAFALGATAIGALAIGSVAVGAFVLKRGRVRTLTVDHLEVRRLHIGELTSDGNLAP